MASEGLAGALAAVLAGRGLRVQGCDSGPAGEPLAPARLRKNVCYVVLAVFLNEQVSDAGQRTSAWVALPSFAKHSHLRLHPVRPSPATVRLCRGGNRPGSLLVPSP